MRYYYLYEIRNNVNGKIYIGVHQTSDLDDGYMGSGKVIVNAINKHGKQNFTKTIIKYFNNAKDMYLAEKEIVDDSFLERDDVYNLTCGGQGGFNYLHKTGKAYRGGVQSEEGRRNLRNGIKQYLSSPAAKEKHIQTKQRMLLNNPMKNPDVAQKVADALRYTPKSSEHKQKISEANKGKRKNYPKTRKSSPRTFKEVSCPHCGKVGNSNIMKRWHFDKCKYRSSVM